MWINLLLFVLTVFLILMLFVNLNTIALKVRPKNPPHVGLVMLVSIIIGSAMIFGGLYVTGSM